MGPNEFSENTGMKKLKNEAIQRTPVSRETAAAYHQKQFELADEANDLLTRRSDIDRLIGENPYTALSQHLVLHTKFMTGIFNSGKYELLPTFMTWNYRVQWCRGFQFDYFTREIDAWKKSLQRHMESEHRDAIVSIYDWLLAKHGEIAKLAQDYAGPALEAKEPWRRITASFFSALMQGHQARCLELARKYAAYANDPVQKMEDFCLHVIQPAMYQVGVLWEQNKISMVHEQHATAIVSKVVNQIFSDKAWTENRGNKGNALIFTCPGELHELGARIVANFLTADGWNVQYFSPEQDADKIFSKATKLNPFLIGISVSTLYNLDQVAWLVRKIKGHPELADTKVLVGGRLFFEHPNLWPYTGADACASDADEAVQKAARLWKQRLQQLHNQSDNPSAHKSDSKTE